MTDVLGMFQMLRLFVVDMTTGLALDSAAGALVTFARVVVVLIPMLHADLAAALTLLGFIVHLALVGVALILDLQVFLRFVGAARILVGAVMIFLVALHGGFPLESSRELRRAHQTSGRTNVIRAGALVNNQSVSVR